MDSPQPDSVKKPVLIVEDDLFLVKTYQAKLKNENVPTEAATDGRQALARLELAPPSVVLLDLMLPLASGFDILTALRKKDAWKNVPVVIVSKLGQPEDIQRGKNMGATEYIVKGQAKIDEIVAMAKKYYFLDEPAVDQQVVKVVKAANTAKIKILLAEDDAAIAQVYQIKLKSEGFDVVWVPDGEAALIKVREFKPDIILLDVIMPKMEGTEVIIELKKDEELKDIPVIFLTNAGGGGVEDVQAARDIGAEDLIVKASVIPSDVAMKVREVLAKKKLGA